MKEACDALRPFGKEAEPLRLLANSLLNRETRGKGYYWYTIKRKMLSYKGILSKFSFLFHSLTLYWSDAHVFSGNLK